MSLDVEWEVAEGAMDKAPDEFTHKVPVPGLVDLAEPAFEEVGLKSDKREAFWYRRTFKVDGDLPPVAFLKIHKAKYGTRVILNDQPVGEHIGCFTPGYFDVREALRGGGAENVLLVRLGAHRESLSESIPTGWDFEKTKYIPGIYDSVELILTGNPRIDNIQTVPDLPTSTVRVVARLRNDGPATEGKLSLTVREAGSGREVGSTESETISFGKGEEKTVDLKVPIENCRLWSPVEPFLYRIEARTKGDTYSTRFGMRSFGFDPETKRALLNGEPYMMRGTNVCIYRFFEDGERGDLPWRKDWVRRLHQKFQSMYWDSIRYCIGFPPEIWYDIADEEGMMIQDEFPIWHLSKWPPDLKSDEIARQYREWMEERWNHPCVVIWDAQNETRTTQTGEAIGQVRDLDLSNRPWENGWAAPQGPNDPVEAHPYLFSRTHFGNQPFDLAELAAHSGRPRANAPNAEGHPIIINEYAWLWINRDGTMTTLTDKVYAHLLGDNPTKEQLRYTYARLLAALTEFWRGHRDAAGVLHFCGLGYSRSEEPRGQTSDHFIDLENLRFEPEFEKYVRDSFAPVGLMIDEWAADLPAGEVRDERVVVINDLPEEWAGKVRFVMLRDGDSVFEWTEPCKVDPLGTKRLSFAISVPARPGDYQMFAEIPGPGGKPIRSWRDFKVLTAEEREARDGIALGEPVTASSVVTADGLTYPAHFAVDGRRATRWSSEFSDPQWLTVDLGDPYKIDRLELLWESAFGKAYTIDVSMDGKTWKTVYKTDKGDGGLDVIKFDPVEARHVRFHGTERATPYGYSLWEMKVFGTPVEE